MKPDILEMKPQELRFIFELEKQSSCSVQMINKTNHHVAFKVKATNPKKYCVRPNTGVIDPNSVCDFTVTMQEQKVAPTDLICRDKFLVQSTFVPEGTKEEDVTSHTFSKEDGKTVDDKRLKVVLIHAPESPESSSINETVQKNDVRELKDDIVQKHSSHDKEMTDAEELRLVKDLEETKSKVKELESKLSEAKATILHLSEEKRSATQERHFLQGELDLLRNKRQMAQVGFPLLFVFMVGFVRLVRHNYRNII